MAARNTSRNHIYLKSSEGVHGMVGRKVVFPWKFLTPYLITGVLIGGGAYLYSTQKNSTENKEFQQEYQETPEFVKDSLLHTFNITPPISLENEETQEIQ